MRTIKTDYGRLVTDDLGRPVIEDHTKNISVGQLEAIEQRFFLPGEQVKRIEDYRLSETASVFPLDGPMSTAAAIALDEKREKDFGDDSLTIETVRVRDRTAAGGGYHVSYQFAGHPGEHHALAFEDHRQTHLIEGVLAVDEESQRMFVMHSRETGLFGDNPLREVVGLTARNSSFDLRRGFQALHDKVSADEVTLGTYKFVDAVRGDSNGPVQLIDARHMGPAGSMEAMSAQARVRGYIESEEQQATMRGISGDWLSLIAAVEKTGAVLGPALKTPMGRQCAIYYANERIGHGTPKHEGDRIGNVFFDVEKHQVGNEPIHGIAAKVQANLDDHVADEKRLELLDAMSANRDRLAAGPSSDKVVVDEPAVTDLTRQGLTAEQLASVKKTFYLPGEQVKADSRIRFTHQDIPGTVPYEEKAARDALGDGPLTIAETRITNADGPESNFIRVDYKFEGHPGEHNAKAFIDHRGQDSAYGVLTYVLMDPDRLFFVPMNTEGAPEAVGPAREIVQTSNRAAEEWTSAQNFTEFKWEVMKTSMAGDFTLVPQSAGDPHGPAEIRTIPWMGTAKQEEIGVAEARIYDLLDHQNAKSQEGITAPANVMNRALEKAFLHEIKASPETGDPYTWVHFDRSRVGTVVDNDDGTKTAHFMRHDQNFTSTLKAGIEQAEIDFNKGAQRQALAARMQTSPAFG